MISFPQFLRFHIGVRVFLVTRNPRSSVLSSSSCLVNSFSSFVCNSEHLTFLIVIEFENVIVWNCMKTHFFLNHHFFYQISCITNTHHTDLLIKNIVSSLCILVFISVTADIFTTNYAELANLMLRTT